jgi:hypothetical protein
LGDAVAIFCIDAFFQEVPGDCSINGSRVHVNKAEPPGKLSRDTAFSRSGRAINGNYPMKISLRRAHGIESVSLVVNHSPMQSEPCGRVGVLPPTGRRSAASLR